MSYGILVRSGIDTLQIDSDQPLSYFKVITFGTTASPSFNKYNNELLFARPSPVDSRPFGLYQASPSPSNLNYEFRKNNGSPIVANYFVVTPVKNNSPSTGYGVHVYNPNGQLAFDSGVFTSSTAGENIIQVVYVRSATSPKVGGNQTTSPSIAYSGSDYASVYADMTDSSYGTVVGTSTASNYGGFLWNSPDNTIRYSNYFFFSLSGTVYFDSEKDIIFAKVI